MKTNSRGIPRLCLLVLAIFFATVVSAIARAEPFAYVTYSSKQIAVVDVSTDTVVNTISGSTGDTNFYSNIVIAPDGMRAYVANPNDDTIQVLDLASDTLSPPIDVGDEPVSVAVSPDGSRAYVINRGDGTVSILDTGTDSVVDTVTVGSEPMAIATNTRKNRIYVVDFNDDTLSVLDITTDTVIDTVDTGARPTDVVVSLDGSRVYTMDQSDNVVSVFETGNYNLVATIDVGIAPVAAAVRPDGRRLYVANGFDDTVSVVDTTNHAVIDTIDVGTLPVDIDVSSDGSQVYVVSLTDNQVSVIDTASNTVTATISSLVGGAGQLADARAVAFVPDPGDPPVAVDDKAITQRDTAVDINVLSNDIDPEAALDPYSVALQDGPDDGDAMVDTNGIITYSPDSGFVGNDAFHYTVRDKSGNESGAAAVNVRINARPVAVDDMANTQQDTAVDIDVLANDSDPDGALEPATLDVQTAAEHGSAMVTADGMIDYTPDAGFAGSDMFTYTVGDDDGAVSAPATVTVTVSGGSNPPGGGNNPPRGGNGGGAGGFLLPAVLLLLVITQAITRRYAGMKR